MRAFFVIHSLGMEFIRAETAGEALAGTHLPLGFRDACAVVDAELVMTQIGPPVDGVQARLGTPELRERGSAAGPFRAFIGQPVTEGRPA